MLSASTVASTATTISSATSRNGASIAATLSGGSFVAQQTEKPVTAGPHPKASSD